MSSFKVGVGDLVSFLYSSGDLSSETFQNVSLLEGTKAHQYVQSLYTPKDRSEVRIQADVTIDDHTLLLDGRIDGLLWRDETWLIEEIKSTRRSIEDELFTYKSEHLAQLKMYAYMYMQSEHLTDIKGRITYIELSSYKMKHIDFIFDVDLLEPFFTESVQNYLDWLLVLEAHQIEKQASLDALVFPFEYYRRGQREMMIAVYQTMLNNEILYAIAPTGIGKTMASLFSTLKAINDPSHKIFYLTAKTQGKKVAIDTMDMLHEAGLKMKTMEITAKDTICFLEKRECDPNKCPFAAGFFDRLREAMQDIFHNETLMTRDVIELYARKHRVCPFEFSLYVSYYVDVIICDYNYAFDPRAHLIRYFEEENYKPLVLVDEAHNMIQRSRDMYSATIKKSSLITLRRAGSKLKPTIRNGIKKLLDVFDLEKEDIGPSGIKTYAAPKEELIDTIAYVMKKVENALKENPNYPKKSDVMDGYLELLAFMRIYEYYNHTYVTNVMLLEDDDVMITMQCLDASAFILDTIQSHTRGTVFFSATLYPVDYHKKLLTMGEGETLMIKSPFDPSHLKIMLMDRISTRYQDRERSLHDVIQTIKTVVETKKGNYIAFFPSYAYMRKVLEALPEDLNAEIMIQRQDMEASLRDIMLERFKQTNDTSQLAFFVMGGMFAEGIDYVGDMLNGVIVVGVGLPMLNVFNNQLKDYYQATFQKGFDYAYTYPGMNKVIQAVGRVIRKHDDVGIAILIDDRFNTMTYRKLFPEGWNQPEVIRSQSKLKSSLQIFWNQFITSS